MSKNDNVKENDMQDIMNQFSTEALEYFGALALAAGEMDTYAAIAMELVKHIENAR